MFKLHHLTSQALGHEVCYVFLHAIQPIAIFHIMVHLGGAWVNIVQCIVCLSHDLIFEIVHVGHTYPGALHKGAIIGKSKLTTFTLLYFFYDLHQLLVSVLRNSNSVLQVWSH